MTTKKRSHKRDTKLDGDVEFRDMWVKKTARGKKCSVCRTHIYGGEQSLRYIVEDAMTVSNKKGNAFRIGVERAICSNCAITNMKKMIIALETPKDEDAYSRALEREKKGSGRNSVW